MAVLTISRQYGSGGDAIARHVAASMGYDLVDKEQIAEAARSARGVEVATPTNALHFLTSWYIRQDPSFLPAELCDYELPNKAFSPRSHRAITENHALEHRRSFYQKTIQILHKRGNIVIVGRAANCLLKNEPDVLRIRIVAPFTTRAYRLVREEGLSYPEALDTIVGADSLRSRYVYESYQQHWDDESLYDLVLNTERLALDKTADLIVGAARELSESLDARVFLAERAWQ